MQVSGTKYWAWSDNFDSQNWISHPGLCYLDTVDTTSPMTLSSTLSMAGSWTLVVQNPGLAAASLSLKVS